MAATVSHEAAPAPTGRTFTVSTQRTTQETLVSLPRFLDIEYCQTDDSLFPTAIAWSLADGQMKTVVIAPDESWLPEDGDLGDVDLRHLEEQGVPLLELTRELHEDLPDQTVYVDGLDPDEILIDLIFSAVHQEAPFEIAPIAELIHGLDTDTLEDRRRQLLFEEGLEPQLPENGVYALLLLAKEEGYLEDL
nr:hypothetical protein [Marinobacter daepoensis]